MIRAKSLSPTLTFFLLVLTFFLTLLSCQEKNISSGNISPNNTASSSKQSLPSQACFNTTCFSLEIAATPETRSMGLMNRNSLDDNAGMLFIFDSEKKHSFWMKNTLIPLDIIWISSKKKIVHIAKNAVPFDETPLTTTKNAKYVLEINGGLADSLGIKIGGTLILK